MRFGHGRSQATQHGTRTAFYPQVHRLRRCCKGLHEQHRTQGVLLQVVTEGHLSRKRSARIRTEDLWAAIERHRFLVRKEGDEGLDALPHALAMKGIRDPQRLGSDAAGAAQLRNALNRFGVARDDGLPRAVAAGHDDVPRDLLAEGLGGGTVAGQTRHRPTSGVAGHEMPPLGRDSHEVQEGHRTCSMQRDQLAQAVPKDDRGREAGAPQPLEPEGGVQTDRRLRMVRQHLLPRTALLGRRDPV